MSGIERVCVVIVGSVIGNGDAADAAVVLVRQEQVSVVREREPPGVMEQGDCARAIGSSSGQTSCEGCDIAVGVDFSDHVVE